MSYVRSFTTMALMQRSEKNIKVRQPLQKLTIKHSFDPIPYWEQLKSILADEINVKEIILDSKLDNETPGMLLDTEITPELKQEGQYRELVRAVQDMRKAEGLSPSDVVVLEVATNTDGQEIINKFKAELIKTVGASEVKIAGGDC